jgi:uncharacterized membrane protein YhaH (DUF805 family)
MLIGISLLVGLQSLPTTLSIGIERLEPAKVAIAIKHFTIIIFNVLLGLNVAKRLHDVGLSGFFALIIVLVNISYGIFPELAKSLPLVHNIFGFLVVAIGLVPGHKGQNEYGDDPLLYDISKIFL